MARDLARWEAKATELESAEAVCPRRTFGNISITSYSYSSHLSLLKIAKPSYQDGLIGLCGLKDLSDLADLTSLTINLWLHFIKLLREVGDRRPLFALLTLDLNYTEHDKLKSQKLATARAMYFPEISVLVVHLHTPTGRGGRLPTPLLGRLHRWRSSSSPQ